VSSSLKNIEEEYQKHIIPKLKGHYLSHVIQAMEVMINDRFLEEAKSNINQNITDKENAKKHLEFYEKGVIRLFRIDLVKTESSILGLSKVDFYRPLKRNNGDLLNGIAGVGICYSAKLQESDRRLYIAHELGHVFLRYILEKYDKNDKTFTAQEEHDAWGFAQTILWYRSEFYKNAYDSYGFKNKAQLISLVDSKRPLFSQNL
jgi:Zn-dependent peptidase ImmA (M78 family)